MKPDPTQLLFGIAGIAVVVALNQFGLLGGQWPWLANAVGEGLADSLRAGILIGGGGASSGLIVYAAYRRLTRSKST